MLKLYCATCRLPADPPKIYTRAGVKEAIADVRGRGMLVAAPGNTVAKLDELCGARGRVSVVATLNTLTGLAGSD